MSYPYPIRLDRRWEGTGVHSGGTTTWTLPYTDPNINAIVLSSAFGSSAGTIITPSSVSGNQVSASGNYSAGVATLGVKYTSRITLTRPFARQQSITGPQIIANARVTVRRLTVAYDRTGYFKIKGVQAGRTDRIKLFEAALAARTSGEIDAWINGDASQVVYSIESDSPRPFTVIGVDFKSDFNTV